METVSIHKAQTFKTQDLKSYTIVIDEEFPCLSQTDSFLSKFDDLLTNDAETLFVILRDSLPGGVFDRLLGKMLDYKASHFIVSFTRMNRHEAGK